MHPILFRIPLPGTPLKLWWALAAVAAIALVYAFIGLRNKDRGTALTGLLVAVGAAIVGKVYANVEYVAPNLPIYSYGVMLGLSLLVGWYITLTLSERDGLPKETMANCYIVTAGAAIVGARLLYILTNLDEFRVDAHDTNSAIDFASFFALRRGGLVAYGGFLGGFVGSWLYLRANKIRLMPWADAAVPSLASGLFITRIGCYLFGCDFGKRLSPEAPAWLAKLGTFPHWAKGTTDGGEGSPAWVKHLASFQGPKLEELRKLDHSFPVHPTQLYESAVGLALLALLLWQRKNQKFRGQIFFLFTFAYGYLRFLLEFLRDDSERGELGRFSLHWFVAFALALFAVAFAFGISLGIKDPKTRNLARVLAFVPPVVAFVWLMPGRFGETIGYSVSTSQWIGLVSALLVAYFYASFWEGARKSPRLAMGPESLGEFHRDDDDGEPEAPKKKRKKKASDEAKPAAAHAAAHAAPTAEDEPSEESDEGDEGEESDETAAPSAPSATEGEPAAPPEAETEPKKEDA